MPDIFDQISIEEKTPHGDIFDQVTSEAPPAPLSEIGRHLGRTGSRITETLLGMPSDVLRLGQLGAQQLEKGAGKIREKIGLEPLETGIKKPGAPGSQELKELSTSIFGEKVVPQSPTESFIDDIVSDAAALALPVKGKIPFLRSIGTAIAGNIAVKGAEKAGVGEKGQAATKLGTFFLSGLTGKGNVKKYWKQQYKLADEAIPSGTKISTGNLNNNLRQFERDTLKKGGPTAAKGKVQEFFDSLFKKSQGGDMDLDELIQFKHDINQNRSGLYGKELSSTELRTTKKYYDDLANFVEVEIQTYGKQNRGFLKHWTNAQEAFSGFYQSKRVGNWISRAISFGKMGKGALLLAEAIFRPATLKATIPAFAAFKTGELLTRIFKNPTLRRFYGNLMKDAVKENKGGFIKNLRSMEKEIKKSDPDIFDSISTDK